MSHITDIGTADLGPSNMNAPQQTSQNAAPQEPRAFTSDGSVAPAVDLVRDVVMTDHTPERAASPAVIAGHANAPSPMPARIGTPSRNMNGSDVASRATSQHPDLAPTIPKEAPPHGAPTRQYLNSRVTGVLLEGMKRLAKEQPKDPLKVLGEYLLQRSKELEGS